MGKEEAIALGLTVVIMVLAVGLREYIWVFLSFAVLAIFVLARHNKK